MQTGAHAKGGEAGPRHSPTRTWVSEPPPFGTASSRFASEIRKDHPDYHVAYRDVTQPPRWTSKGWVGIDDYIKPHRGTAPSVLGSSSLVPPSGPPRHGTGLASLAPPCPNEVRLQELLNLQRRRVAPDPGPGAYEIRDPNKHRRFRRQHDPQRDGPFFLDQMPDGVSTRSKEIAAMLRPPGDSGLGPGDYDGLISKDKLMRTAPVYKLGNLDREGRAAHIKSLSISRSIQNGIDWHVPVIVQPAVPSEATVLPEELGPSSGGAGAAADDIGAGVDGASPPSTANPMTASTTRPCTAERLLGLYNGSRASSPTGSGAAEQCVVAPPPPPSQVSRAVRREQQRRPGDWDWNRLGVNYRTSWTTLHGGAYSQGEHTPPRSAPNSAPATAGPSTAASQALLPHQPPPPQQQQQQGIYPILEETSSAMQGDPAAERHPYYVASFAVSGGLMAPGPLPGGGGSGPQGPALVPPPPPGSGDGRMRSLISDEDLRRRRAAADFASRAQQANTRVADWQSKFAG